MRTNYILECLSTLPNLQDIKFKREKQIKFPDGLQEQPKFSVEINEIEKSQPSESDIQEMIHSIMDTLPHLGDGTS